MMAQSRNDNYEVEGKHKHDLKWTGFGTHKHKAAALAQCYAGNDSKDGYNYRVVEKEGDPQGRGPC